jgi:hypothetical protein
LDSHPVQNYSWLAISIVIAAGILGAALLAFPTTHTTATSTSTVNSTETSTVTEALTQTTTLSQTVTSTLNQTVTTTVTSGATSNVTLDSVNQNGETVNGYYTLLGGIDGSIVIAEGPTPDTLTVAVGQTYSVRDQSSGGCTFSEWSDGVTTDQRSFTAASGSVSYTAVFSCSNTSPTSAIFQSCTGYSPTVSTVTQTMTPAQTTTTTITTPGTEPATQSVSCTMSNDVQAGDTIVVKLSDVPTILLNDSLGNDFTLLESELLPGSTYYSYIYYTIASSTGPDTLTLHGAGNYPSIMAVEIKGTQAIPSYYSSVGHSNLASVGAFSVSNVSFVIAFVEPLGPPISVSAGAGYTLATMYAVSNACEYGTISGQTAASFVLGAPADWEEVALVFS